MKVLAINCGPTNMEDNTVFILKPFLDGMEDAGAQVDLIDGQRLKVRPCRGDYACIFETPGICSQKDDMQSLYSKIKEADITVWSSSVNGYGATGVMNNMLNRAFAISAGAAEKDHQGKQGASKPSTAVLISSCGQYELNAFDPILAQMAAIYRHSSNSAFTGALLRPHAQVLESFIGTRALEDISMAAREAGKYLIVEGEIPSQLLEKISEELLPVETYIEIVSEGRKPKKDDTQINENPLQNLTLMSYEALTAESRRFANGAF
jgi:multimeric flavodoxin WrbA